MTIAAQIKEKEKSLAELMARILQEPLNPLAKSMARVNEEILQANEAITAVREAVDASAAAVEDTGRVLKGVLSKMRGEDFPGLERQLVKQDERQTEAWRSTNALLSEKFLLAAERQAELAQASEDMLKRLEDEHVAARAEQIAAVQSAVDEIRSSRSLSEQGGERLAAQLDTCHERILTRANEQFSSMLADMADAQRARQLVAERLEAGQKDLANALNQQHASTSAQLSALQTKLKHLSIITGVLLTSTLAYIGYEVWSKLHAMG